MLMFTDAERNALSVIRVSSMLLIVACHICQAYHNIWAEFLNVGVQIFLVLSGYLYGRKYILSWREWSVKRLLKVYLPFVVFLTSVIPLYTVFHPEAMRWKFLPLYYLNLDGFRYLLGDFHIGKAMRIEGLRHVWFITAIMFAYLSTPLLQWVRSNSKTHVALVCLTFLVAMGYVTLPMRLMFTLSWVYLYAFGYLLSDIISKGGKREVALVGFSFLVMLASMAVRKDLNYWSPFNRCFHDVMGIAVVVVGGEFWLRKILRACPVG